MQAHVRLERAKEEDVGRNASGQVVAWKFWTYEKEEQTAHLACERS